MALKRFLGRGVAPVPVRVVMEGELPIGLADLLGRGIRLQAQDLVIFLGWDRHETASRAPLRRKVPDSYRLERERQGVSSAPSGAFRYLERRGARDESDPRGFPLTLGGQPRDD